MSVLPQRNLLLELKQNLLQASSALSTPSSLTSSSKMSRDSLKDIEEYLTVLGLDTTVVPTLAEYREAYKKHFHLHPDKNLENTKETTELFQKITEAAQEVFQFLTANGDNLTESDEKTDILSRFVKTNRVVYNSQCVTFYVTKDTVEAWKKKFEEMLGCPTTLPPNKSIKEPGLKYKKSSWSVPSFPERSFGKISVTIYHSTFKVVLQSDTYLDFTTFALTSIVESLGLFYDCEEIPVGVDNLDNFVDVEETVKPLASDDDGNFLIVGFKCMEDAVVALKEDLINKVDESLNDRREQSTLDDINLKIDKLGDILNENKREIGVVKTKLTQLAENGSVVKIDQASVKKLAAAVSDISDRNTSDIVDLLKDVKDKVDDRKLDEVVKSNREVLGKLEVVEGLSESFSTGLKQLESIFERDIFNNVGKHSAQSAESLNTLNGHMVSLLSKFDTAPIIVPNASVDSSSKKPNDNEAVNPEKEAPVTPVKVNEKKVKRGKFFTSSVARGCDIGRLEHELNCNLQLIETYHIIENPSAPNPEKFLKNMLETHLKPDDDIDFIVISVGSNDITKLDTKGSDTIAPNDAAIKHTEVLVKLARDAAKKHGIEAFIMERPSRYDKKDVMKPRLNQVANGMLMPLTNILDNVHIIRLPSLDNLVGKAKKDLFKDDGIHLTDIGQTVLEDDMIAGIRSSYKDLKPKIQSSQRNNPPPTNNHSHRGGRERRVEYDGHPDGAHGRVPNWVSI